MTLRIGNGSFPQSFGIADFNNDTHMDIAVVNAGTNNMSIFLGYVNVNFTDQRTYLTGSSPSSLAVGDFNGDIRLDIVVANYDDSNVGVFLADGNDSFTNQTTYSTGFKSKPCSVVVDDLNNDSFLDIIVANYGSNNVVIFLGHGNGTFEDRKEVPEEYGAFPYSVVVADFDNDKKLDFVIANSGIDSLQIQLQTC